MLHGFIARDGTPVLWAETDRPPADPLTADPSTAGPLPADPLPADRPVAGGGRRPSPHPFAVAAAELAGWLPGAVPRPASSLVLPTAGARPLASPHLGRPVGRGRPRWRAWTVPGVVLPWGGVADALGRAVAGELAEVAPGLRVGASIAYLAEVCAFATDLIDRGRVLPGVLPDGPRPRASWRPLVTGRDATRHAGLLRAMPPACRAERSRPGDVAGLPAADALHAVLHRFVDATVRVRLATRAVCQPIARPCQPIARPCQPIA